MMRAWAVSKRGEQAGGTLDERCRRVSGVGLAGAKAPNRVRPGGIGPETADHVKMELRDHVSERAEVDLVGLRQLEHDAGREAHLADQRMRVLVREVDELRQAGTPRDEHDPGKARVVEE